MKEFYLLLLFITTQFVSCDKTPTEPPVTVNCNETEPLPSDTTGIWPLKSGNTWLYKVEKPEWIQDTLKMEITGSLIVCYEGQRYKAVKMSFHGVHETPPEYEWLYWSGTGGVYLMGGVSPTDTFVVRDLELKYPANVGDKWEHYIISYSFDSKKFYISDTLTYTLAAKDVLIETPAGNYKCYVYQYSKRYYDDISEIYDFNYYYVPNLGLAKFTSAPQDSTTNLLDEYVVVSSN